MLIETHYSQAMRGHWYVVNDTAGQPLVVSPALFANAEEARTAAEATLATLAAVAARHAQLPR